MVAHIFGEPADMPSIMRIARRHRIPVVEDCAQAHAASVRGRMVGTFGDIAAFSLMFGKHMCAGGQSGMVFTRNAKLYWAARRVADRGKPFGLRAGGANVIASLNCNMDEMAAAVGRVQLRKLPGIVRRRRALVARIARGIRRLSIISLPEYTPGANPSYWYFRLKFNAEAAMCDKATFCKALAAEGIIVRPRYVNPVHMSDWYQNRSVFGTSGLPWTAPQYKGNPDRQFPCPNAIKALDNHFDLSIFESWSNDDVEDIVAALRKVTAAYAR